MENINNYKYKIKNDKAVILSYVGNEENVVIPEEIEGKKVKKIDNYAFYHNSAIKSIIMPNTVEEIEDKAFSHLSNLKSISLSDNLEEIEESAFSWCVSLKEIILPLSLEQIDENVFSYCQKLEKLNIPKNAKIIINDYCFSNLTSLKEITLPKEAEEIGKLAFLNCKELKKILLPKIKETLSLDAFRSCNLLESIGIYKNTKIKDGTNLDYYLRSLNKIIIKEDNNKDIILYIPIKIDMTLRIKYFKVIEDILRKKAHLKEYDNLFEEVLNADEKVSLAIYRLINNDTLLKKHLTAYVKAIKENFKLASFLIIESNNLELVQFLASKNIFNKDNIDLILEYSLNKNKDILAYLMNYKNENFGVEKIDFTL